MEYYFFTASEENGETIKLVEKIDSNSKEYIIYNDFLNNNFGTSIIENEEYIPQLIDDKVIMVLAENLFEDLNDVFEVMFDCLYINGGK